MRVTGLSPRRWLPRVSYHRFDGSARPAFTAWFTFGRFWHGRLWCFTVKHHQLTLDFRGNWLHDATHGKAMPQ